GDVVTDFNVKILERCVILPIVQLLHWSSAHDVVGNRSFIPRSDEGKRGADSHSVAQAEFGLHYDRVTLSRIVGAFAGHAIAVQIEVSVRSEVLVRNGEVSFSRWRKERLCRRLTIGAYEREEQWCRYAQETDCVRARHGRRPLTRSRLSFSSMALSTAAQ